MPIDNPYSLAQGLISLRPILVNDPYSGLKKDIWGGAGAPTEGARIYQGGANQGVWPNTVYRGGRGDSLTSGMGSNSEGVWVTPSPKTAEWFATNAPGGPASEGSMVAPMRILGRIKTVTNWTDTGRSAAYAKKQGYDGVHFPGLDSPEGSILVFDPEKLVPHFGR